MNRHVIAAALIAAVALPGVAAAKTRADIMKHVIRPCVEHEVKELDLKKRHAAPAATIMFELDRDYYEDVVDAVEEAFRDHPNTDAAVIYDAGRAACIQNQGSWTDEPAS